MATDLTEHKLPYSLTEQFLELRRKELYYCCVLSSLLIADVENFIAIYGVVIKHYEIIFEKGTGNPQQKIRCESFFCNIIYSAAYEYHSHRDDYDSRIVRLFELYDLCATKFPVESLVPMIEHVIWRDSVISHELFRAIANRSPACIRLWKYTSIYPCKLLYHGLIDQHSIDDAEVTKS